MVIHDDLIKEFKIKKNVTLQASDIWESRDLTLSYISDKKLYVLLEGDDDSSVSGEARRAAASDEYKQNVAALALCSNKLQEKIIGSLFLNILSRYCSKSRHWHRVHLFYRRLIVFCN